MVQHKTAQVDGLSVFYREAGEASSTLLKRLPTISDVAETAAFPRVGSGARDDRHRRQPDQRRPGGLTRNQRVSPDLGSGQAPCLSFNSPVGEGT
jgi:hypothetical protein